MATRNTARKRTTRPPDGRVSFPKRERTQVATYLELDPDDPVILALIAVSRESGLSVFRGELFALDVLEPSRNAEGAIEEKWRKRAAAGRDGLLAVARRTKGFVGVTGDVVCSRDSFAVDWGVPPMQAPLVKHMHAPLTAGSSAAEARDYRGAIVGAWARIEIRGQLPFFYFAHLREHGRRYAGEHGTQWAGAWEYTSAMILKCAMSYVLRIKLGITGIVPADELKNDPGILNELAVSPQQLEDVGDAIPAEHRETDAGKRLLAAVRSINDIEPTAWPAAKCEMAFPGRSEAELGALADQVEGELASAQRARGAGHTPPEDSLPPAGPATPLPQ